MKEKDNISDHNNECIPSDMLIKYIKGELSGLERNRIERHISSCEMCSDEFEGLSLMENSAKIDGIEHELNQKIDSLVSKPAREIPYLGLYIKIAASIVLLLGISSIIYFVTFHKSSSVVPNYALMEAQEAAPSPPPSSNDSSNYKMDKSLVAQKKMEYLELDENRKSKKSDVVEKENVKQGEGLKYVAPVIVDSLIAVDDIAELKDEAKSESIIAEDNKVVEVDQVALENVAKSVPASADRKNALGGAKRDLISSMSTTKESIVGKTYNEQKEVAIRLYTKGKYKDALIIFNGINNDFQDRDTILFYASLCNYYLNRFEETINKIASLEKNPKNVFYNQAKWYFALALIGADRKEDAITILEQILKEDSPFKDKAKKELKKLKGSE